MSNVPEILNQIIKSRKSVFPAQYTGEELPSDIVEQIVDSANFAPNHKKTYPWRLRTFRKKEKEILGKELMRLYKENTPEDKFSERTYNEIGQKAEKSDTMITISVNFSGQVPQWEEIAATAMAVQNMYLTCTANGVGCYWGTPGFISKLKNFLQLEENQECYGIFFMGKI
ncbi:MAG: nitroreductase family protein [Capnocytophaga sp.]|nr:nitroreductase family protein [Capnocytophaga sp.]